MNACRCRGLRRPRMIGGPTRRRERSSTSLISAAVKDGLPSTSIVMGNPAPFSRWRDAIVSKTGISFRNWLESNASRRLLLPRAMTMAGGFPMKNVRLRLPLHPPPGRHRRLGNRRLQPPSEHPCNIGTGHPGSPERSARWLLPCSICRMGPRLRFPPKFSAKQWQGVLFG